MLGVLSAMAKAVSHSIVEHAVGRESTHLLLNRVLPAMVLVNALASLVINATPPASSSQNAQLLAIDVTPSGKLKRRALSVTALGSILASAQTLEYKKY